MSTSDSDLTPGDEKRPKLDGNVSESAEGREPVEHCYVCDDLITGKKYPIANCLTNTSKSRLIEILGRLVSEKYVVVVSNIDKICRTCANLLNNLDRLESELMTTKQTVLGSIEKKYNLHDDDLYSRTMPKSVVFGNTQNLNSTYDGTGHKVSHESVVGKPFKGKSVLPPQKPATPAKPITPTTSAAAAAAAEPSAKPPTRTIPKNVLMQCNQCQYTTNQRPVMLEHLRQHKAEQEEKKEGNGENKSDEIPKTSQQPGDTDQTDNEATSELE
ncbi:Hypothetical predicted protein [Cloeon dipterum]|uniref:C2H2-type domain-containing protein n=1 Tax=Cloeon dipterum TaxID=197152 RepID=A0A8S1C7W7_9INSE|nr:Hypothetical predicted protein [Cloeon dipterum]